MSKTIYINPDEEITSVVDRLVQAKENKVNLAIPAGAQIFQSSISLKLLKREANFLNKEVVLFVPEANMAEIARNIGFEVKNERELPLEEPEEIEPEQVGEPEEITPEQEPTIEQEESEDAVDFLFREKEAEEIPEEDVKGSPFSLATLISTFKRRKRRKRVTDIKRKKVKIFKPKKNKILPKINISRQINNLETVVTKPAWYKFFFIFIGLALITAFLVGYLVLPTTEITIIPKREATDFDLLVVGSKDITEIDQNLNKIPLQEVRVTESMNDSFRSTGEEYVNKKARGTVTIYNEYSSESQVLVATTRFETPDHKIYRIEENIRIPGAKIEEGRIIPSSIEVELAADQPGEEYNIGLTNFTIPGFEGTPKFAGFYAKSKTEMTGGAIGKMKVVSADDLAQAKQSLEEKLKEKVNKVFEDQMPGNLKILDQGMKQEITNLTSNIEQGTQAEEFTLEMSATVRALYYNEEDLEKLADFNLLANISKDKTIVPDSQEIELDSPVIDWDDGQASFYAHVKSDIVNQIDTDDLKEEITGKNEVEVRKYLTSRDDIERAKVSFWPFWVKKIPLQEKKIKITIDLSSID